MRWITQEGVQIDRMSSAWLIRRFVDAEAEFAFVPRGTDAAAIKDGTPFHLPGAALSPQGDGAFATIVENFHLAQKEPALGQLVALVQSADRLHSAVAFRGTPMSDALPSDALPETAGLQTALQGVRALAGSDTEAIERASVLLDAFLAALKARASRLAGS